MGLIPHDAVRTERQGSRERQSSFGGMPVDARPRGESWTGPFLWVLVILAGPVRGRVLVRLPDAFDAVDVLDVVGDASGHEGFAVAGFPHPLAHAGPGRPRPGPAGR